MDVEPTNSSYNFVCIDVDSFSVADNSNNNNNSNINQKRRASSINLESKEESSQDYTLKFYGNNFKSALKSNSSIEQRRRNFAQKLSPTELQLQCDVKTESIMLQSKSSKCSAHFDDTNDDDNGMGGDSFEQFRQSDKEFRNRTNSKSDNQHFIPRKSLLGKPIMARNYSRQDAQYRKLQSKIYNFLERPKNWQAVGYHILVFASVFTCLVLSVLSTIEDIGESAGEFLFYVELSVLFWFFTEYCMRMWSAGCRSRYQTWRGRILFAKQPFCLVDLIVILASIVVLALGSDRQMFAASALRGLRFFQILRMIRMDRRGGSWKLLASVVWAHRQELFTTIYIGFLVLVFSSFLIYLVEKDEKDKIKSYADALWWGVITLCTVGYGDTVPKTALGKLIAGCCAIAGISFFALPAGILGSGFALKVQQHQRHKHLIRRRMPAANLIQCLWRCYSSDPQSTSVATWKPHFKFYRASTIEKNVSIPAETSFFSSISAVDKIAKFSRLSTIKRRCEKLTLSGVGSGAGNLGILQPQNQQQSQNRLIRPNLSHSLSTSNIVSTSATKEPMIPRGLNTRVHPFNESGLLVEEEEEEDDDFVCGEEQQVVLENGDGTTPYFPVTRRNALAQPGDKAREEDKKKFGILDDFFLNRYTSVASMNRDESEDWDGMMQRRELTLPEKNAIRFIRKTKFFVAARKFKEALRPYDLKDIIEQYSSGHVDMLARIKGLQARIDNLFGGADVKENQDNPRTSLASRIIKIESRVENIELKLDKLLHHYRHQANQQQSTVTGTHPHDTTGSTTTSSTVNSVAFHSSTYTRKLPSVMFSSTPLEVPQFSSNSSTPQLPHTPPPPSTPPPPLPSLPPQPPSRSQHIQHQISSPKILYRKSDEV